MIDRQTELAHDHLAGLFRQLPVDAAHAVAWDVLAQGEGLAGVVARMVHGVFVTVQLHAGAVGEG